MRKKKSIGVSFFLLLVTIAIGQTAEPTNNALFGSSKLLIDLNADSGVVVEENNRVVKWYNAANSGIKSFSKQDKGRKTAGSGRPTLLTNIKNLNGHNSIVFLQQELLNDDDITLDSLITGAGFTWIAVVKPYTQAGELRDVNSFFGNLKNGGNYEGFWAGFTDENFLWTGVRNGITFGRWDTNNQRVSSSFPLDSSRHHLIAGRMQAGTTNALIELFINDLTHANASGRVPVNTKANPSKLSIGQERDAIEHPGVESFRGEIARFLVFRGPLTETEMKQYEVLLKATYQIH